MPATLIGNIRGPAGPPGSAGPAGPEGDPGLVWRGAWDSASVYNEDDAVTYQGSSYRATEGIAAGVVLWHPSAVASLVLDADTINQASGSSVSSWLSTGSVAYQAQQATAGLQPKFMQSVLGGRGVVRFDGVAALVVSALDSGAAPAGFAMLALVNLSVPGTYPMVLSYDPPPGWEIRGEAATGTWQLIAGGGSTVLSTSQNIVGAWRMLANISRQVTGVVAAYTDGTMNNSATASPGRNSPRDLWIGKRTDGYPMTGDLACAIVVKGDLSDADRQRIEGWMAHRWGVTASLPAGHPYKTTPPVGSGSAQPPSSDTRWELLAAKGDPGVGSYRHVQTTPGMVWTITHNLSFRPSVTAVDSTGREITPGEIDYPDAASVTLTFSAAVGGEAYLS